MAAGEEVTTEWRKLCIRNFMICAVIGVISSRSTREAKHVACIGQVRSACVTLDGKSEGKIVS